MIWYNASSNEIFETEILETMFLALQLNFIYGNEDCPLVQLGAL